jgi:ADP-ribose pyrophosphatase YjhB (NUDIX family)
MPGAHRELDESIEMCPRRNLLEETGYQLGEVHGLVSFVDPTGPGPANLGTVFWARYDGVHPLRCYQGQALAFIGRHRASEYDIPLFLTDTCDLALEVRRDRDRTRTV